MVRCQKRYALGQCGSGVPARDPQLPLQRREGRLIVIPCLLQRLAGEPAQHDGAKQRANPAAVVRLLVLPAELLLLLDETFRQTLRLLRLQAVVDHLQDSAAHLPQQPLQILLKLVSPAGTNRLSQKRDDPLENFPESRFRRVPALLDNSLQFRADYDCQHQTVMGILRHRGVLSSEGGLGCQTGHFPGKTPLFSRSLAAQSHH